MSSSLDSLLARQTVAPDLILHFVLAFSRFEFALKAAGYLKNEDGKAEPNWSAFAKDSALAAPAFPASTGYLSTSPPFQQVALNGELSWKAFEPWEQAGTGTVLWYASALNTVRNNLFHGGKFPVGPITEPARDTKLLAACLSVIDSLLDCAERSGGKPARVAAAFARPFEG